MSRKVDPNTPYRMICHRVSGRNKMYASTKKEKFSKKTGKPYSGYVHWGTVDSEKKFEPNIDWLLLDPDERKKFIFPPDWDLSAVEHLPSHRKAGRPRCEEDQDRFYGDIWLLEQIADKTGIRQDLEKVFHGNRELVADILTIAMFPYLSKMADNHLEAWQHLGKFPAVHKLSPSRIARLKQHITEEHRAHLLRLRVARVGKGDVFAVDSTTRSAYGHCLTDVTWGKSKDHLPLPQTVEVVAYSLKSFSPVYYRQFAGNMPDVRSFRPVLTELRYLGISDVILITDRGYESSRNLQLCVKWNQALITAAKIRQKRILTAIDAFGTFGAFPEAMTFLPEYKLYAAQYDEAITVSVGKNRIKESEALKLNLFFDPVRRAEESIALDAELHEQERELLALQKEQACIPDKDMRRFNYYKIQRNAETHVVESWERDEKRIEKARRVLGFFALYSLMVDGSPEHILALYKQRDLQEKYFSDMKTKCCAAKQHSSTDSGKAGSLFILFVSLVLVSYLKHTWQTSRELRRDFRYSFEIIETMRRIHCLQYPGHPDVITPFVGKQIVVCDAFHIEAPPGCLPN